MMPTLLPGPRLCMSRAPVKRWGDVQVANCSDGSKRCQRGVDAQ